MKNIIAVIIALFVSCAASFAVELNVTDYGAVGDGKTDNTAAFQKALDAACKAGGGRVRVPAGMFLIQKHLSISYNTSLVGEWDAPPAPTKLNPATLQVDMGINARDAIIAGSVLLAVEEPVMKTVFHSFQWIETPPSRESSSTTRIRSSILHLSHIRGLQEARETTSV